jgi:hypothetical protein
VKENMKIRGTVFFLTTFVMSRVIESISLLKADEAWLTAAMMGVLVAYWISPIPGGNHLRCISVYLVLTFGIYLFGFKVAKLLTGFMGYRLAVLLCLAVYGTSCWLFVRRAGWIT